MNHTTPLISIIINYFNPDDSPRIGAMIRYCLECYAAYTRHPYELLVVDGSGQPGPDLEQHCEARGWRYLVCEDKGAFARIYNLGMINARGDYRVWSASDIFVCQGWDDRLVAEMRRTGAG